ncbi:ThiF family adenylyltransferase [Algoriphagus jejuensis]|uniref:ThiF family adenylyltransferase n=1 Tax=Algoriphagus jejuensis TaxID=419934 RepID=UPI0031D23F0D
MIKLNNPTAKLSDGALEFMSVDFFRTHSREVYGNWVFYPWNRSLVHVLPKEDFVKVRTIRNRYKITEEEQQAMSERKIGVVGLSVGQSVATCLAMERSFGELRIADFDTLELANMNRIRTSVTNLGLPKTQIVTREIAEIDPYLKVTVFNEGLTDENMSQFFSEGGRLDLFIEECDSLEMKIKSRIKAKALGIPVLMDTSDRGMIDIERFDLDSRRPIFHGMLSKFGEEEALPSVIEKYRSEMMMSILDFDNLSPSAKLSIGEIGKTITTWPQLASSVIMGGAMAAYFSRQILSGHIKESGRVYVDLDGFFNSVS